MEKKAVFFDADGTLCDIKKGVPQNNIEAVSKLVGNGHEAWLCTGRSRAFVPWYLEQFSFTGMVCGAGTMIEKGGERLFNKELPPEVAEESVYILRKYGMVPVMEGADFIYYDKDEYNVKIDWYADLFAETIGDKWMPISGNEKNLHINKISAKVLSGSDSESAFAELSKYYDMIRHEKNSLMGYTLELVPKGFNKGTGVARTLSMEGMQQKDSVVFGDSNNDLEMFQYAAFRVAMKNSSPCILELADYVTEDIFNDGISQGLKYLGLI